VTVAVEGAIPLIGATHWRKFNASVIKTEPRLAELPRHFFDNGALETFAARLCQLKVKIKHFHLLSVCIKWLLYCNSGANDANLPHYVLAYPRRRALPDTRFFAVLLGQSFTPYSNFE
jgi:hypothetical protein